jgi:hypothetical protein
MRARHLVAVLGLASLVACGEGGDRLMGPNAPRLSSTDRLVTLSGGTYERHLSGPTSFVWYSGGYIEVQQITGTTVTTIANIDAVWSGGTDYTQPAGSQFKLIAHPYSGCSLYHWAADSSWVSSASSIIIDNWPNASEFRGEFLCQV